MSEPRNSPAAGPNPIARAPHAPRWRDIQFVEFEADEPDFLEPPAPAARMQAAAPAAANSNEPSLGGVVGNTALSIFDEPAPEPSPPPSPRAPRYGRAIAPLPRHLIASVPAPPRTSLPPAPVKLRPATARRGKLATLRDTPFPQRRSGRAWRWAIPAVALAAVLAILYRGEIVSGFAAPAKPPLAPPAAPPPSPVAAVAPVPPAAPSAPDRVAALTAQAKTGDSSAQYALAVLFARGDGVAKDYSTAATWFREAAINGNIAAQYNLAVLYERGLGIPQNMNEALIWYHSAASRNYPAAQYNLALSYADGRGTPQDMVSAARWYLRAAEQGVVPAMVNYAILCEGGQGTIKSPMTAYAWYRAAAGRGDEAATKRADELYRQFSADDREGADAAAASAAGSIHEPAVLPAAPPNPAPSQNSVGLPQATG